METERELTVEVTELDNLRSEYMHYEAAGEDYLAQLEAQLMSEYQSYLEEDAAAAEDYLAEGQDLIRQLGEWARSAQHQADCDFVAFTLRKLDEEVQRQHFTPRPDDQAQVYLAGESHVCFHYGNKTDSVRLVYTREGVEESIAEAVRLLDQKREARLAELRSIIRQMQDALIASEHNTQPLDPLLMERCLYSTLVGPKQPYLFDTIHEVATGKKSRRKYKWVEPELHQRYLRFVKDLGQVAAPLLMAACKKTLLYRFMLAVPKKGEIAVSWDPWRNQNYLYGQIFDVQQDYMPALRAWWATSCVQEMKRLKAITLE